MNTGKGERLSDPRSLGAIGELTGIPIQLTELLPAGRILLMKGDPKFGTRPMLMVSSVPEDPVTIAGRVGRRIVREGLADVLAWLGQPVEQPWDRIRREILDLAG